MRARLILGLVVFACVATPARAEEPTLGMRYLQMGWGWEAPTGGEAAFLAPAQILLALDVWQTLDIARNPKTMRESNPWMGPHPSQRRVLLVGLGTVATTTAIWVALPPKVRWLLPVVFGSVEIAAVTHNFQMGVKLGF